MLQSLQGLRACLYGPYEAPLDCIVRYRVYSEGVSLKIGEVAQRGGVSLQAIRYYEREGLLPKPPRLASGYRLFPDTAVRQVHFIKRAQELGFSLAEIRELLSLREMQTPARRICVTAP